MGGNEIFVRLIPELRSMRSTIVTIVNQFDINLDFEKKTIHFTIDIEVHFGQ